MDLFYSITKVRPYKVPEVPMVVQDPLADHNPIKLTVADPYAWAPPDSSINLLELFKTSFVSLGHYN